MAALGKAAKEVYGALSNIYRSRLEPAIKALPQEKMQAAQAEGFFNKFPGGVGKDELEYTGVQGMIDAGQPVTKTGLLEQYNANPLQINDVYRGNVEGGTGQNIDYLMGRERMMRAGEGYYSTLPPSLRAERADKMLAEIQAIEQSQLSGAPKFEDYTLPGGKDYRELLMTTPTGMQKYDTRLNEVRAAHGKSPNETGYGNWATEKEIDDLQRLADKAEDAPYSRGHYDEPNILAHARYNTRNIDGDKTLFIEEIQSDWHQAGRKAGYNTPTGKLSAEKIDPKFGDGFVVKDENGQQLITISNPTGVQLADGSLDAVSITNSEEAIKAAQNQIDNPDVYPAIRGNLSKRVPDAPYKSTDKWQSLAFRRTVKEAVDQGHDRIAWTKGDVQADRYNLSKQVDTVDVIKHTDGGRFVDVRKDGESILDATYDDKGIITNPPVFIGKSLEDVLGKELSEKVMGVPESAVSRPGLKSGVNRFEAEDLKVGGEGMKSFYDKMMVNTANKFGKKYGAKVEVKRMGEVPGYEIGAATDHNDRWFVNSTDPETHGYSALAGPFKTQAEATNAAKKLPVMADDSQEVWSMKITPEMKKAMAGGVSLSGAGVAVMPEFPDYFTAPQEGQKQ